MKYLIHCENGKKERIGAWVEIPSEWSSEDYGKLQEAFVKAHGKKKPEDFDKYAEMTNFHEQTTNGVLFDWGLAGSSGAAFDVFWMPDKTREQVAEAKAEIRSKRDVVRMKTTHIHRLVEFSLAN